jgi:hypothetical protein
MVGFFTLVAILGARNIGLLVNRQTTLAPQGGGSLARPAEAYSGEPNAGILPLPLTEKEGNEEVKQQTPPQELIHTSLPAHETIKANLLSPQIPRHLSLARNQELLPLWRHRVDCPAGASALCSLDKYEVAGENFGNESGCAKRTALASISEASRAMINNARRLLRKRLTPDHPGASSALTGYAPSTTLQIEQTSSRQFGQIGCSANGKDGSYDQQIIAVEAKWRRQPSQDLPLGFTMTDRRYAGLVEEQLYTAKAIVGLETFFVVAYDKISKEHICNLGADAVTPIDNQKSGDQGKDENAALSQPGGPKDRAAHEELRSRTTLSKFIVARSLARQGISFIFWEMDVFIFKKPYQIFAALQDSAVDLVISSHQVIAFDLVFCQHYISAFFISYFSRCFFTSFIVFSIRPSNLTLAYSHRAGRPQPFKCLKTPSSGRHATRTYTISVHFAWLLAFA